MSMRSAAIVLLAALGAASPAPGLDADTPAALLTFPYVRVDPAAGVDTHIRLANTDTIAPLHVVCLLDDATPRCSETPAQACTTSDECGSGSFCVPNLEVARFALRLRPGQPVAWRVGPGGPLPLAENGGPIPPAPRTPLLGALRCFAADAAGAPVARNALQGAAQVERVALDRGDVAAYNAVGAAATAVDDDGVLTLGGPAAEYDACPEILRINHALDQAADPIAPGRTLETTLALVPCGGERGRATPPGDAGPATVLQFLVRNEFGHRFSTSAPLRGGHLVMPLSRIDTLDGSRSIFSAAVQGTLTATTTVRSLGGGVVGVALEARQANAAPGAVSTAAYDLHSEGARTASDDLRLRFACTPQPVDGCRAARFSRLLLSARGRRAAWEWRRGDADLAAALGAPQDGGGVALCMYGGAAGALLADLTVPAAPAAWQAQARRLTYRDPTGSAAGVRIIALDANIASRARVAVRAAGPHLPLPDLSDGLITPLRVQLVNDRTRTCLESTFAPSDVLRNRPGLFAARSVSPP